MALLLAERGHDVVALDLRPGFLEYAKSRYTHGRIRFVAGNALECELDERFDLVFANQIIEHVVYPEQLIRILKGLLNSNGTLVVTTPNWHYLRNNLPSFKELGDASKYEHLQFTADGDGHFFAYNSTELEHIFANAGFKSVESHLFEVTIHFGTFEITSFPSICSVEPVTGIGSHCFGVSIGAVSCAPANDCCQAAMNTWQQHFYYSKDRIHAWRGLC